MVVRLSEIYVLINGDDKGLNRALDSAERNTKSTSDKMSGHLANFGAKMAQTGAMMSAGLTLPIVAFGKKAFDSAVQLDTLTRALTSVTGSSAETAVQLERLREVAKAPGLGFAEAVQGSLRLQAAGMSARAAEGALKAFGNAIASAGGGKAQLDGVTLALSQIAAKGKVFAEEINQINERVPQIRSAMKAAFGTSNTEQLQKMGITSEEFVSKITAELGKIPTVTGGVKNQLENLSDSLDQSLSKVGVALIPVVTKLVDAVTPAITQIADSFSKLPESTQLGILGFVGLLAAAGPLVAAFGAVATVIGTVGLPVIALAAGIAALGIAFATNAGGIRDTAEKAFKPVKESLSKLSDALAKTGITADSMKAGFMSAMNQLGSALKPVVATIMQAFSSLIDWFTETLPDIQKAMVSLIGNIEGFWKAHGSRIMSIVGPIWEAIKSLITAVMEVIGGAIRAGLKLMQGDWKGAWLAMNNASMSAGKAILAAIGHLLDGIRGIFNLIIDWLAQAGRSMFAKMMDAGRWIIDGLIGGIKANASRAYNFVKNLGTNVVNAAKSALKIHSPSKAFGEIGENIVQGLIVGIETMGPVGIAAAKSLANSVIQVASDAAISMHEQFKSRLQNTYKEIRIASSKSGLERLRQEFDGLISDKLLQNLLAAERRLASINTLNAKALAMMKAAQPFIVAAMNPIPMMGGNQKEAQGGSMPNPWVAMGQHIAKVAGEFQQDRAKRYADTMRDIALQVKLLGTSSEESKLKIKLLSEGMTEAQAAAVVHAEKMKQKIEQYQQWIANIAQSATDTLMKSLENLKTNGFGSFFRSVLDGFREMMMKIAMEWVRSMLYRSILGALSNISGSAGRGVASAVKKTSTGSIIQARAMGGPVQAGSPYLVGERGPELFVPNRSGQIHPNGSGVTVHITVHATDAASFKRSESQIAAAAGAAIQKAMARGG